MSSDFNFLDDKSKFNTKRTYFEDDEQCEMSKYIQCKKIKLTRNENSIDVCCSFNQNFLPPSPPLDNMKCDDCEYEEYSKISLTTQVYGNDNKIFEVDNPKTEVYKINDNTLSTKSYKSESKIQQGKKTFNIKSNKQHNKTNYIQKFTLGYRNDCKKCRDGVPNHYGHIN